MRQSVVGNHTVLPQRPQHSVARLVHTVLESVKTTNISSLVHTKLGS